MGVYVLGKFFGASRAWRALCNFTHAVLNTSFHLRPQLHFVRAKKT